MIIRDADNEAGCPSAGVNCVEVSFLVLAGAVVVVYSEAIEYGGFFIAFVGIHYLYSKFTLDSRESQYIRGFAISLPLEIYYYCPLNFFSSG